MDNEIIHITYPAFIEIVLSTLLMVDMISRPVKLVSYFWLAYKSALCYYWLVCCRRETTTLSHGISVPEPEKASSIARQIVVLTLLSEQLSHHSFVSADK